MAVQVDAGVIGQIADVVRGGKCILFLGAGVHAPPPDGVRWTYDDEKRPASAEALSETLAGTCNLADQYPHEDPRNLQRVALFYEIARSRRDLVDQIRAAVHTGKEPSPVLRALAELDFKRVITTNYDQLFEFALRDARKQPRVSVYTPNVEAARDYGDPSVESPIVFKIHGDIDQPETVVVTDEDYIQFVLRMGDKAPYDPVGLQLKANFAEWTTLFVGYSLIDYNLRLLFKTLRSGIDPARIPDTYSVDFNPDPLILDVWHNRRRYVKFIAQDVWAFVPQLYELVVGKAMPDYNN